MVPTPARDVQFVTAVNPTLIAAKVADPRDKAAEVGLVGGRKGHFQIELAGKWQDYEEEEDLILKRVYMSGFSNAKFHLRGHDYEYNFRRMVQVNKGTGKERMIRPPMWMKPPAKPLVAEGPTFIVRVRPGQAGRKVQIPHPKDKSVNITVVVPRNAKPGQELLVPIPILVAESVAPPAGKKGGHTGTKVVVGAGLVVGGAILYLDEDAHEAAVDAAEDALKWTEEAAADIGEWVPEAGADAGDWIVEAGDSAGGFVMDLFG